MRLTQNRRIWAPLLTLLTLLISTCCTAAAEHPFVYSTLLGGQEFDSAFAISVDRDGNAFVTGVTVSTDFPLLEPWQATFEGTEQVVFLAKVDSIGRLLYSTYFGGSGWHRAGALALDQEGNVWISGHTDSVDLPTTSGAFQPEYGGGTAFGTGDAFIAKFSGENLQLLSCSYIGGTGDESSNGVAVDLEGNILVSGTTDSDIFPGATVVGERGRRDAFVLKLNPSGEQLIWSRIIAGSHEEDSVMVRVGSTNAVFLAGSSVSTNLPVTADAQHPAHQTPMDNPIDGFNGFFGVLDPDGSLRYLSFLGPQDFYGIFDFAVSGDGAVILAGGGTTSSRSATAGAFQETPGGGIDGFVMCLRPPDWKTEWFSYLGGSNQEEVLGVAVDASNNVYVAGSTLSRDFPLKNSFTQYARFRDAFVAKISADGTTLLYSTTIGGNENDSPAIIALGADGFPVVAGSTSSADFPVHNAFQPEFTGSASNSEAFIAKINVGFVPIARPQLEIVPSGKSLVISWPADAEGFVLESSSGFSPDDWKPWAADPLLLGSRRAVVTRPEESAEFFRLRRP